jgi:hypothetical protein
MPLMISAIKIQAWHSKVKTAIFYQKIVYILKANIFKIFSSKPK